MGPQNSPAKGQPQLGYHVTLDSEGNVVKLVADFDYPKGDLSVWGSTDLANLAALGGMQHIIRSFDFDALSIHIHNKEQNNTMKLTPRQNIIVGILRTFAYASVSQLVLNTGAPAATVRRNIGALRNKGFNIDRGPRGYVLVGELGSGTDAALARQKDADDIERGTPQSEADDLRDEYSAPEYHDEEADVNDYDDEPFYNDDFEGDDL